MKGAGKYAEELKALVKKMAKETKSAPLQKQEALRAMTRAIFCFDTTDARADEALTTIDREFVDINELRVATELEVQHLIGDKFPQIVNRSAMIYAIFNNIFEKEGVLGIDRIAVLKKAEIRQFLHVMAGMSSYVEAYVCLNSYDIAAMPVDEMSLAHLKQTGCVVPDATIDDAQKFIEGHLNPQELQDLFAGLRRLAKETFVAAAIPAEDKAKKKK